MKIRKQRLPLIIGFSAVLLLIVLYFALVRPLTAAQGETTTTAVTGEGEGMQYNMGTLYPGIKREYMLSITVHNAEGTFSFCRLPVKEGEAVSKTDSFVMHQLVDGEMQAYGHIAYDEERFSELVVATGTFYFMKELSADAAAGGETLDLSEYGLAPEDDPAWFEIKLLDGAPAELLGGKDTVRVYVGDAAVTENGYYAYVAGRENKVYVSNSTLVGTTALCDLPSFVDPILTSPFLDNGYYYTKDFTFWRSTENGYVIGASDSVSFTYYATVEGQDGECEYGTVDLRSALPEVRDAFVGRTAADAGFSYTIAHGTGEEVEEAFRGKTVTYTVERIERVHTLYIALDFLKNSERSKFHPFVSYKITAPAEKVSQIPNDDNYMDMLMNIGYLTGSETVAVGLSAEVIEKYGLNVYRIYYQTPTAAESDATDDISFSDYMPNYLYISEKQEDGTYLVGSVLTDIVARVDGSIFEFLHHNNDWWFDDHMYMVKVVDVSRMEFEFNYKDIADSFEFRLTQTVLDTGYTALDEVFLNGKKLDVEAFTSLYMHLATIYYSGGYDGEAPTSDVLAGRAVLTFRITLANDGGTYTYRFYPYSPRHVLVSLAEGDGPEGAYFYVISSDVEKIYHDIEVLIGGGTPDPEKQY